MPIFVELSIIIVIAAGIAFVMKMLKQPLIVGYIATGILVGPYAFNILQSEHEIELFSKIGISILLFILGLGLNPDVIKEVGKAALVTGLGQVLFTSVIGYFIVLALGYSSLVAVYVAVALTFSSTIIVIKLLTDRGDADKLYGKISMGFLLVQDLVATLILLAVTVLSTTDVSQGSNIVDAVIAQVVNLGLVGLLVSIILYYTSKYILPKLSNFIAGNQEVLFVFSIAWGLGLASVFYSIGFSIEIGALVAGVMLAVSPFAYEIGSRMKPLRDFFILLFFILLGAQMVLSEFTSLIVPVIILSIFVLIGNPIIVYMLMNLLGYRSKTSFMAGLAVAQISEFSLILISLGLSVGHLDTSIASLVTLVGIVTIAGSTYLILYADEIYPRVRWFLNIITIRKKPAVEPSMHKEGQEMVIFGYDRVGQDFVKAATRITDKFVVVDFNPQSIKRMQTLSIPFRYGDAEDVEFLQEIGLQDTKLVVSSIPEFKVNLLLVQYYRKVNADGIIIVIAHEVKHAQDLYLAGATYVIMPHFLGAHHGSRLIADHGFDLQSFEEIRNKHLVYLQERAKK
jgi:Kef-type K+ transport system membrane component KefB